MLGRKDHIDFIAKDFDIENLVSKVERKLRAGPHILTQYEILNNIIGALVALAMPSALNDLLKNPRSIWPAMNRQLYNERGGH